MKPLSEIQSAWKELVTPVDRFELVLGGEAVLDRETGLVWEQAPGGGALSWADAVDACFRRTVGSRRGWRLATIEEQMTLSTPGYVAPALPDGHPFDAPSDTYWTITSHPDDNRRAYGVFFLDGSVVVGLKVTDLARAWCVRGGRGPDPLPGTVN
jgi:hypothetical protein